MRGFQGVGYIAPRNGASTAVCGKEPGAERRLPLSSRDLCEHPDTGVVVTVGNFFLCGVGPGHALSLGFWISWQFRHRTWLVFHECEESFLPFNGQPEAYYLI